MRFLIFAALALLSVPASGIDLIGHRMKNVGNRCTYACMETSGRAQGMTSMHGFMMQHVGPGYMGWVRQKLKAAKIKHLCFDDGVYNRGVLKRYAPTHGVTVTILAGADFIDFKGCHSILILDYGDEQVEYYDPNHPLDFPRYVSREKFDKYWSGNLVIVMPGDETPVVQHKFGKQGEIVHPTPDEYVAVLNDMRLDCDKIGVNADWRLTAAAQRYARICAAKGYINHHHDNTSVGARIKQQGFNFSRVEEVLVGGAQMLERDPFADWRDSPSHYSALLGPCTNCGFGVAYDRYGYSYFVGVFATPAVN